MQHVGPAPTQKSDRQSDERVRLAEILAACLCPVSALDGEEMAEELQSFIRLVMKKRRTKYLRFMLLSFIRQYRDAHNIKMSRLITAVPDTELEKRISDIVRERKGDSVLFEHRVDPSIIGGFIFEIDGLRLDASTAAQLKSVRRQFIEKNRRIV